MTTRPGARRRHLASSPFPPELVPTPATYVIDDMVSHDSYGVGRVVGVDVGAVTVNFGEQTVRIPSPFNKMEQL